MENAKDPDEFMIKYGVERFNLLVEKAISLVEFKAKMLKQNIDLQNINDKIKFLKEIAILLSKIESKIEQEIYLNKFVEEYDISKEAIYAEINKLKTKNQSAKILEKSKPIIQTNKAKNILTADEKRENIIIALLIKNGLETYKQIDEKILLEDFKSETNKKIAEKMFKKLKNNKEIGNVLELFDDENIINKLSEILIEDYEVKDEKKALEDIINIYEKERLTKEKNEIIQKLAVGDVKDIKILEDRLNEIIRRLTPKK